MRNVPERPFGDVAFGWMSMGKTSLARGGAERTASLCLCLCLGLGTSHSVVWGQGVANELLLLLHGAHSPSLRAGRRTARGGQWLGDAVAYSTRGCPPPWGALTAATSPGPRGSLPPSLARRPGNRDCEGGRALAMFIAMLLPCYCSVLPCFVQCVCHVAPSLMHHGDAHCCDVAMLLPCYCHVLRNVVAMLLLCYHIGPCYCNTVALLLHSLLPCYCHAVAISSRHPIATLSPHPWLHYASFIAVSGSMQELASGARPPPLLRRGAGLLPTLGP